MADRGNCPATIILVEDDEDVSGLIRLHLEAAGFITQWQDRELAFESGADDYLTKPFRPADLISRVRALCERRC
jgi:DNA-binding response OmpR family regulator